ncbi:ceramidase domain-containing protein [Roseibium sp. RKSG952]|uniref:ceramidase domain-containing protein n=1 Tax=Roseibium sp. RKSG952 TaxID=2529384 RepID=UPI0012BD160B|nr:ceramidase domain-containing protein [Roseibium sp. RKSG952]MTH96290.1 hypothetical protein [Roseibium sp. RKSG952]
MHEHLDHYCERLGPAFWAEPFNAITNASFIIAALVAFWIWRRKTPDDWWALALIIIVFATGTGSFLFHTFATRWALLADVIPIALFICLYLLVALRRYLQLHWVVAIAIVIGYLVLSPMVGEVWAKVIGSSAGYLPALLAIFVVGGFFYPKNPRLALWLLATGVIFGISLTFRSLDSQICASFAIGTHFLWHILNGLVLFLLLRVLIWHRAG